MSLLHERFMVREGIYALNFGSGSILVTSTGVVSGTVGINASNYSSLAGDLAISVTQVDGQRDGIFAYHAGVGALTITATDSVAGLSRYGITAQNTFSATGDLSISVADVTGGLHGVSVNNNGRGVLSITSTGVVSGQGGMGRIPPSIARYYIPAWISFHS